MADIVNLNAFRKDKERAARAANAAEKRAAHGRTKAARELEKLRQEKAKAALDQHRLDRDDT